MGTLRFFYKGSCFHSVASVYTEDNSYIPNTPPSSLEVAVNVHWPTKINPFLDSGCEKESPNMPKAKSPSSGRKSKVQNGGSAPVIPDANPVTAESPVDSANLIADAAPKAQAAAAGVAAQSVVAPEPRKFELHKPEQRRNLVPINIEDEIRRRAYEIFEQRGCAPGGESEDWLAAEREVMQRYRQQRA
jgi:hypothetical protein